MPTSDSGDSTAFVTQYTNIVSSSLTVGTNVDNHAPIVLVVERFLGTEQTEVRFLLGAPILEDKSAEAERPGNAGNSMQSSSIVDGC